MRVGKMRCFVALSVLFIGSIESIGLGADANECDFANVSFLPDQVKIKDYSQGENACSSLTFKPNTRDFIEGSRKAQMKSLYIDEIDGLNIAVRDETKSQMECVFVVPVKVPLGCSLDVYLAGFKGLGVIRQRHRGTFDILVGEYSKLDNSDFGFSVGVLSPGVHNFSVFTDFNSSGAKRLKIPCKKRKDEIYKLGVLTRMWVQQKEKGNGDFQSFLGARSFTVSFRNQGRKWRMKKCT